MGVDVIRVKSRRSKGVHHLSTDGVSVLCGRYATAWEVVNHLGHSNRCCVICASSYQYFHGRPACSIDGCDRAQVVKGMCISHYHRVVKDGEPGGLIWDKPSTKAFIDYATTFMGDECLIWPHGKAASGYGMASLNGSCIAAHRAVCTIVHGQPPTPELEAAHGCGVRACVNPRHLRWATPAENAADKIIHGTVTRGEQNPSAKLDEASIREIRKLIEVASIKAIARKYNVSASAISEIRRGLTWKHVV